MAAKTPWVFLSYKDRNFCYQIQFLVMLQVFFFPLDWVAFFCCIQFLYLPSTPANYNSHWLHNIYSFFFLFFISPPPNHQTEQFLLSCTIWLSEEKLFLWLKLWFTKAEHWTDAEPTFTLNNLLFIKDTNIGKVLSCVCECLVLKTN